MAPFAFGELLTLLDVEGSGALSAPFPTPIETARFLGQTSFRDGPLAVLSTSSVKFRTGLNQLWRAPTASIVVTPFHVAFSLGNFADTAIWTHMFDWVASYFADTLTKAPKGLGRSGYRAHTGGGVFAEYGYEKPRGDLGASDATIEITVRRDEPAPITLRRILGVPLDGVLAPPDDGNWHDATSALDLHLELSRQDDLLRIRYSAPIAADTDNAAAWVSWRMWEWTALLGAVGRSPEGVWELGNAGQIVGLDSSTPRRKAGELHVPWSWSTP